MDRDKFLEIIQLLFNNISSLRPSMEHYFSTGRPNGNFLITLEQMCEMYCKRKISALEQSNDEIKVLMDYIRDNLNINKEQDDFIVQSLIGAILSYHEKIRSSLINEMETRFKHK